MIGAEVDVASSFVNKGDVMEQEDGEVSDVSNGDLANDDGEIVEQQTSKPNRKEDDTLAKTDVNASKKTALEKLKNMSFSSRSKLPVRSSSLERRDRERKERQTITVSKLQHSPRRDNDEERKQRKRRWEEHSEEQERQQVLVEERPRPLREAVAATHVTPLATNKTVEAVRSSDQPHTLRQRIEKVISVQESEAINMSDKELRNLIARMCELSKEQERLQRGRQTQYNTLRDIYMEVKDDIEKLYIRVPVHLRMDLPLPLQALHPSASSSSGPLQMNGGTTAFQLEQRFRLPSLFDPPQVVASTNMRLNSGSDPEASVQSEERCSGSRMVFGEVGNVSNDSHRVLGARNGTVYSSGLNEHGMFEDMNRVGLGSGNPLSRNDGSNPAAAVERLSHTCSSSEQTIHSASGKKPLFPGLNGPVHMDQSVGMIPSTSACDLGPKPLFSRLNFGDGSSRFTGSGTSHELFPKGANDLTPQMGRFTDGPPPLMGFGNTVNSNQTSQSTRRQAYDAADKSAASTYTVVQTNALSKLDSGDSGGVIRTVSQHSFMHSGSQGPTSFIHPNKPSSPVPDFPSNVSLRAVSNSVDNDNILCNTSYHDTHIHLKSNEIQSSLQVPLPNLSEPPPPFGTASANSPAILPNKLSNTVLLNPLQSSHIVSPQTVPVSTGSASLYPSEHVVGTVQPLSSASTGSVLNTLPGNSNASQNLQLQPANATVAAAQPLMSLHSGTSVSVPPPDFSVPPPLAPSLTARTNVGTSSVATNLLSHTEPTSSVDSRTRPPSNPTFQRSLPHMKGGIFPSSNVLSGLPSMSVPPPSFSVPPPRGPNVGSSFSVPPPMSASGIISAPRPANLMSPMAAPPPNLMSGSVGLSCPPPDMSQPPPNIRNALGTNNPENVQQMVNAVVGQSTVSGQTPVEVVTELIANAYNRAGGVRLHHDSSLKQRMSMTTENTTMINKMKPPAPAGPPMPLSSVGKLPPPLMLSPGTCGSPASRIASFNKRKGTQIRSSTTRPQQRQKRQISDMVAIIPDEHGQISDHPSSREDPDDNIFLIVSDEEDGNK